MVPGKVYQTDLGRELVNCLQDMGRAYEKLKSSLDSELFNDLSKHNPYWESAHEPESDKLYDIRCRLSCLSDTLWDVVGLLDHREED